MTSLTARIAVRRVDTVRAVAAADWDRLAARNTLYLSHIWVRGVEDMLGMRHDYVLVTLDGRLVGALPVHSGDSHPNPRYRPAVAFGDLEPAWHGRFTIAGASTGYHTDLLVDADLPPALRHEVVAALVSEVRQVVRREGTCGAFLMFCTEAAAAELAAHAPDAVRLAQYPEAEVPLPGRGFDDYLAGLPTAKRRRRVRAELRAFAAAGYECARQRLPEIWREAVALVAGVEAKYGGRLNVELVAEVLRVQCAQFGDIGVAFTARRAGRLVGFCLCYPWHNRLHARMVGFDYASLAGAFEYFALTYYQPIEYCYQHGLTALNLGAGAYRAKTLRGARLAASYAVVFEARRQPDRTAVADWNAQAPATW